MSLQHEERGNLPNSSTYNILFHSGFKKDAAVIPKHGLSFA
ncbi:hypothetical protein [Aestuariivivens sp. NBU2969]|nr:hypothetical protein [Aestuariivivens sp. NBU2969]